MSAFYRFANHLIESISHQILGYNRFGPLFLINYEKCANSAQNESKSLINEIMSNGFVFAVQKKRRTVERKLRRRFGVEAYPNDCSIIRAKQNITVCDNCGHFHELHTICGNCYKRVKEESNLIIDELRQHLKYNEPIEEEIHIKYKNDSSGTDTDLKGRRVVEMERQRPEWFAQNLLTKSVDNKWIERNPVVRDPDPKVIKD